VCSIVHPQRATRSNRSGRARGVDGVRSRGACRVFSSDEGRVARALERMPAAAVIEDVAATFKVLAHRTRIRIVHALGAEELCVCDLARVLGVSVSATSHQLKALRAMKIVQYRVDGKLAYYSLRDPFLRNLLADGVRHATTASDAVA
jgi:DNA-binding transcriptional ArsR family regulator